MLIENPKIITGNIFTSETQTIVNTVNTKGVMGKGLSLEFRLRYPEMYKKYKELCKKNKFNIGELWLYKAKDRWILNFPTKDHWREKSKIEYIEKGLIKFLNTYKQKGINSITFPVLGSNLGGIPTETSLDIMKKYLSKCEIPVFICLNDIYAEDDIYNILRERLIMLTEIELSLLFELNYNQINKLKSLLNDEKIKSVSRFLEIFDVQADLLDNIFDFALMRYNNDLIQKHNSKIFTYLSSSDLKIKKMEIINFFLDKNSNKKASIINFIDYILSIIS